MGILAVFFLREKITAGIGAGIVLAVLSVFLFAQS
jgi:drug/metabolite transporter (DMT)-like permease